MNCLALGSATRGRQVSHRSGGPSTRDARYCVFNTHASRFSIVASLLYNCHGRRSPVIGRPNATSGMDMPKSPAEVLEDHVEELTEDAVVWASQHGLVVGAGVETPAVATVHAPMALLPCTFPRARFQEAVEVMPLMNVLVDRIARNEDYLRSCLARAAEYDNFTGRLLKVLEACEPERVANREREIVLCINRSDYMLDQPSSGLLQVELNTIASSFGSLSTLVTKMHCYLLQRAAASGLDPDNLPENHTVSHLASGIALAAEKYGHSTAVVLMVVQPGERNSFDQQWISLTLWEQHGVRVVRKSLREVAEQGELRDGALWVDGVEVSVVYLRSGYAPSDYPSEIEWEGRMLLERSTAAKCPSVAYHLAGAKKVQQDLARPGVVEELMDDADAARRIRLHFAGLWSLDDLQDPATQAVLKQVAADPDAFVLKPQREGGGYNLYGEEAAAALASGGSDLAAFILMQRIKPPAGRSVLVRRGKADAVESLSELGIYGTFVRVGDQVHRNVHAGHVIRTKASTTNEGGVAAGFAVLDSPYLVDA